MAAIVEAIALSGQTIYGVVHDKSAQLWNGSSFEVFTSGHWSSYLIPLTEQTSTGYYVAVFPASITAGKYSYVLYLQAGGSPAIGDTVIGSGSIYWNGTQEEQGVGLILASTAVNLSSDQSGVTIGTVNALSASALANILTQVRTALSTDQIPELTVVPSATPTLVQALMLVYMSLRNNHTATSTQESIYNNAGTAITTSSISDDGTTYTKGKFA